MNRVLSLRRMLIPCVLWPALLIAGGCTALDSDTGGGGSGDSSIDAELPPVTQGSWYRPGVSATWQWQLQPDRNGQINTGYAVDVYDVDLFNTPESLIEQLHQDGRKVVAYFSAGTFEDFRPDSGDFSPGELGKPLADFPDERWLDIRSGNVRRIVLARLDLAAQKGFDGVEPDNVDGYANNSGFALTADDQLAFNRFVANAARERGMAVGLKNDLDQIAALVEYFDFAVNEQCHEYAECDALRPFVAAGKPVFNAEYAAKYVNNAGTRQVLCSDASGEDIRTLVLPVDLDDSFRFSCEP